MNKWLKNNKTVIFIFIMVILVSIILYVNYFPKKQLESFDNQSNDFVLKTNDNIYDEFYCDIYDRLVYYKVKTTYETEQIVNSTKANEQSILLDIGSGTGHHVNLFQQKQIQTIGIDNSSEMIKTSKQNYPNSEFKKGDMINSSLFSPQTFTHITCFYFTIYYTNNKPLFFENCFQWLKPGGYLVIHLVNREMFDPLLNNPLLYVSPQRYAKQRLTMSKIVFNNFEYKSDFEYLPEKNKAIFHEKFYNKDKVRKNEHELFMESPEEIEAMAHQQGFITQGMVDLIKISYEYQYLYIFVKPN